MTSEWLQMDDVVQDSWDTAAPFHCKVCETDVVEGWRNLGGPPVHADCGTYLIPSKWLVKWYTHRAGYWSSADALRLP